ncbi:MAG: GIY-YIG nuclease family protein [Chloroflexi bacterium]|nr:GIY-YIG nuclease family protein [Chloroflexota bacterium]MCY3695535.1 GIY-YIG nuclease family protein [Chloroflexota bacterium]
MAGIVYVLSNPSMPNLLKIGKTTQADPQVRIDQLYTSGVPVPFVCEIAVQVKDEVAVERALHLAFSSQRVNPSREFFELETEQVRVILDLVSTKDVTPAVNELNKDVDEESRRAGRRLKSRRPNLNFVEMRIPIGSELHLAKGGTIAVVESERSVRLGDEVMSLTRATRQALGVDYSVTPGLHWLVNGRLLGDIYDETYR